MHSILSITITAILVPVFVYSKLLASENVNDSLREDESINDHNETDLAFDLSPRNLRILAETEEKIYHVLRKYYTEEIERYLDFDDVNGIEIFLFLGDYERSTRLLDDDTSVRIKQAVSHPSLILRMLIRITLDLPGILEYFDSHNTAEIYHNLSETVENVASKIGWPDEYDLDEAFMGILRIHKVYDLDLEDLVRGIILEKDTGVKLESRHCFLIGHYAFNEHKYFAQAVEWLEMAAELASHEEDPGFDQTFIQSTLLKAVRVHDEEYSRTTNYSNDFFFRPIVRNPRDQYKFEGYLSRMKQTTNEGFTWKGTRESSYNDINFRALCSGDNLQTEEEKSKLYCYQDTKVNPYWTINPLRTEILSQDPYVAQFYNILSPSMIDKIMNFTEPKLSRAQVYNHTTGGRSVSRQRTSFNTWLYNSEFPETAIISRKAEFITLLNVVPETSSELLQIAAYTFGGHYDCHVDAIKETTEYFYNRKGGRIATLMFYLSDVDAGGYTAFPIVGIAARPEKGSAVFWFNLHGNGKVDYRSYHGACPVVLGESKWVANKWIRSDDQFLVNKCEDSDFDEDSSEYEISYQHHK